MVLGFLNSIESVTTTRKVRKSYLTKRGRNSIKKKVVREVKQEYVASSIAQIDDIQPNNIHTLLCNIDQRVKMCETYLVDMTGKITGSSQLLLPPPPLAPLLPPPLLPPPIIPSKPPETIATQDNPQLNFLQELKDRVRARKEQADLGAINSTVEED